MNLDKNSSIETIKTKINDQNKTVENNTSITNNESNASINNDLNYSLESNLDFLKSDINISTKKLSIDINTSKEIKELKNKINKKWDIIYNDIDSYREWWKPFITFNWNVLLSSKDNLLVFWDWEYSNKKDFFKLNLEQFLDFNDYEKSEIIYVYREWEIIEAKKSEFNYLNKNWDNVKIYFWDIISNKIEDIEKNILDINILENIIWSIKINNINKEWDFYKINLDTRLTNRKSIDIFYDLANWNVFFKKGDKYLDKWDFFNEDINFYKKFRKTFSFFENNNMFDEPLNEKILENWKKEQLDWHLRAPAINALKRWDSKYNYNWIDYDLYKNGKVSIPQVCIDYPLDFYEKFNDSYFDEKWNHPDKVNFEKIIWWFFQRRRIWTFIKNLKDNINNINDYFTIHNISEDLSIAYNDWSNVEKIIKNKISKQVNIWDLILIEWKLSDDHLHRHSVMVSSIQANWNIIIQENAAVAKEESLLWVLSRWPNRRIKYIVKPTDFLLQKSN